MSELDIIKRWPRYENGEFVNFGDELPDFARTIYKTVKTVQFNDNGVVTISNNGGSANINVFLRPGERLKCPAPKVLDADGVEIYEEDTAYLLPGDWCGVFPLLGYHGGEELKVVSLRPVHGGIGCVGCVGSNGACFPKPSQLTHRILAADGKPLREEETVYRLDGGGMVQIDTIFDASCVVCLKPDTGDELGHFTACELTHERPDSWERLEDDAQKDICSYFEGDRERGSGYQCQGCPAEYQNGETFDCDENAMAEDLVRRARALAERGR